MRGVAGLSSGRSEVIRLRELLGSGAKNRWIAEPSKKYSLCHKPDSILRRLYPSTICRYADISERRQRCWFIFLVFSGLGSVLLGFYLQFSFFLLPLACYAMQRHALERRCQGRQADFDRDYAALLMSLSSGMKTGLDPLIALIQSAQLFQENSIMRSELESIQSALEEGASEDDAIAIFGARVRHPDIKLFRMAFTLARKEGATLSHCLRRLARVVRQRQSFRRKTRGAVAMQKLSAFGIAGCTLLIGIIQGMTNQRAFVEAFVHPIGRALIVIGISLVVVGIVWMLKMAKIRV